MSRNTNLDKYEIDLRVTVKAESFSSASVISEYIESFLRHKSAAGLVGVPIVSVDLGGITLAGGPIAPHFNHQGDLV